MRRALIVCCFLVASVFSLNAIAALPVPTYSHAPKAKTAKAKTTAAKPKPKAKAKAKTAPKQKSPTALVKSGMPAEKKK